MKRKKNLKISYYKSKIYNNKEKLNKKKYQKYNLFYYILLF